MFIVQGKGKCLKRILFLKYFVDGDDCVFILLVMFELDCECNIYIYIFVVQMARTQKNKATAHHLGLLKVLAVIVFLIENSGRGKINK